MFTNGMDLSKQILSDVVVYSKYSRYLPKKKRRETWDEIVSRNMDMHIKKYPSLANEIRRAYQFVYDKKVLPSMRSLQFGGKPIEVAPNRIFNCAYLPVDDWHAFHETMFLLLGGTGVGYSVQRHHVEKLPRIQRPIKRKRRHLVADSIEGWADAVKVLMKSYFFGASDPVFDFSIVRPKGAILKTSGGKAPGPQPLHDCLHNIRKILDAKEVGTQLKPIEVHDIMCHIADAVLSGGIRRSAMISLFSFKDKEMFTCKYGDWNIENPQRGRANNSAVAVRHKITKADFLDLWKTIKLSGCGEPGIYFTNNAEWGTNPCVEIALRALQFCNLVEINAGTVVDQTDLNNRACVAAFIATLQAGYTDFHYLRDAWKETTEKEALIGVGMTGIASGKVLTLNLEEAAEVVKDENARVAAIIGINVAARTSCVKPAGTSSAVLGVSSGIHAWHADHYIRRITVNKEEPLHPFLAAAMPDLLEDSFYKPNLESVFSVPIKAPRGSILRENETAIQLLERVKKVSDEWVKPGHRTGDNTHNISCTVSIKEDEWKEVGDWMWKNRDSYNGISVMPFDGGTYVQTPFEGCSKYIYDKMIDQLTDINLSEIIENQDNTNLKDQVACSGDTCEIL